MDEGLLQHKGDKVKFSPRFGQGSVIGVHLDTWHGTLSFYQNRQFIGVLVKTYLLIFVLIFIYFENVFLILCRCRCYQPAE